MDIHTATEQAYKKGYEDALKYVAKIICDNCAKGCPFKDGCEVYSDKACVERIVEMLR